MGHAYRLRWTAADGLVAEPEREGPGKRTRVGSDDAEASPTPVWVEVSSTGDQDQLDRLTERMFGAMSGKARPG